MILGLRALRELGLQPIGLYGLYQLGLHSGYFRWRSGRSLPGGGLPAEAEIRPLFPLPTAADLQTLLGNQGRQQLLAEADQIVNGQVRLFGATPVALDLAPAPPLAHWTAYELGRADWGVADIKFTWEPARLGWVFVLGRAYHLSCQAAYAEAFWSQLEAFWEANPADRGPNWASAQEVALRLLALAWSAQVFQPAAASTPARRQRLAISLAEHAERIPPSLMYARAQNNNHLLSEAAGLITAAQVLPQHPHRTTWARLGWHWFNQGLLQQIAPDGSYSQHSSNYLRLALQLATWVWALHRHSSTASPRHAIQKSAQERLSAATRWLLAICDYESGELPNLGANDGAYVLPLANLPFKDYRPALQAAGAAFLGQVPFAAGQWDEVELWLGLPRELPRCRELPTNECVLKNLASQSWAYLRVAHFTGRPGHADQLHLDLWWRGLNLARDAGTYRYSAPAPWENALAHTAIHNTVVVAGQEQMTRAGRFLYLDWAQAQVLDRQQHPDGSQELVAQHDGYLNLGVRHTRQVIAAGAGHWLIKDLLQPVGDRGRPAEVELRLHWLLPDWLWEWDLGQGGALLQLRSPWGWVRLQAGVALEDLARTQDFRAALVRGGTLLAGNGPSDPTWGWVAPTYGVKQAALSLAVYWRAQLPVRLVSIWQFPELP